MFRLTFDECFSDSKLALKKYPQDGTVGAHCGIVLPLSGYRSSILEVPSFAGPIQVQIEENITQIACFHHFDPNTDFFY